MWNRGAKLDITYVCILVVVVVGCCYFTKFHFVLLNIVTRFENWPNMTMLLLYCSVCFLLSMPSECTKRGILFGNIRRNASCNRHLLAKYRFLFQAIWVNVSDRILCQLEILGRNFGILYQHCSMINNISYMLKAGWMTTRFFIVCKGRTTTTTT